MFRLYSFQVEFELNGQGTLMAYLMKNDFYVKNAKAYYDKTKAIDPGSFLTPFTEKIEKNAPVFDVGCGSGRDLLWLKNQGFDPTGIERSPVLAELARTHSDCPVIEADYETFDFSKINAKGIMFSASLVHLPHVKVETVLGNSLKALLGSGYIYLSLKEGRGTKIDEEKRCFYLWEDHDFRVIFTRFGLETVWFEKSVSKRGTGEMWLSYTLKYRE